MQASLHTTLCVVAFLLSIVLPKSLAAQDEAKLVRVAKVEKRILAASQMNVGTVIPIRTSVIGSAVDGRVLELLVEEGEAVEANQPVARLRTAILEIPLAGAKAELTQLQQRLAELENGATEEEVLQSQARLLAAGASRKFASWDYKRISELFEKGQVVTENELQKAQSDAEKEELMGTLQDTVKAGCLLRMSLFLTVIPSNRCCGLISSALHISTRIIGICSCLDQY